MKTLSIIIGALLSAGLIVCDIFAHLTKLGVSIHGNGTLFTMAVLVLSASFVLVLFERKKLLRYIKKS